MPYANKTDRLKAQRKYREKNRESMREKARVYTRKNRETIKQKNIRKYYELKKWIFDYYGYICNCCGEDNPKFLTIDHVNNDGYLHRDKGSRLYSTIKKDIENGGADRYQIYCYNCNCAKRLNGGICPHMDIREIE